jgi:hypothetical protein
LVARAFTSIAAVAAVVSAASASRAQEERVEQITDLLSFQAGDVEADPALRELTLRNRVVVTYQRYRIESDALHLALTPGGIMVEGEGRVAFCPCADPPIAIAFSGGRVAPPGDLLVSFPRLEVLGVPVFALPYMWLRSPEKVGLLPPRLAWRADDGLLAGAGVHVPWRGRHGERRALDLRAAGYLEGGAEVSARFETPASTTFVLVDEIRGTRAVIDARGSLPSPRTYQSRPAEDAALSWDIDAVRGDRARTGTIELAAAAQPFDAAAAETSLGFGVESARGIAAAGLRARAVRGEGRVFGGPLASAGIGGPLASLGSWDTALHAMALGDGRAETHGAAAAMLGAELDGRPGPLDLRLSARGRARVAQADSRPSSERAQDAVAAARFEAGLPLARSFGGRRAALPLVHTIGPIVEARAAVGGHRGAALSDDRIPIPRASWLGAAGGATALGNYAGRAVRLEVRGGAYGAQDEEPLAIAHARVHAWTPALAAGFETALVGADPDAFEIPADVDAPPSGREGAAVIGSVRLGPQEGPYIAVDAAGQSGAGAAAARAVAAGTAAALPGDELSYLDVAGWTGGAEVQIPWTRTIRTNTRADADLTAGELLAIRGGAAYRHPCGCVAAELVGLHRLGREGVDVWLTVDLAPP